jgi:hypothetical protein
MTSTSLRSSGDYPQINGSVCTTKNNEIVC